MANSVVPYKHGVMIVNGQILTKWQSGNINIETPRTEVNVLNNANPQLSGFVFGPNKCTIDVENAIPANLADTDEVNFVDLALNLTPDDDAMEFQFSIGERTLSSSGYLTSVKFSDSPDGQPKCSFSAICTNLNWADN